MERVPLELWREIFSKACTDKGFTGCSLSLVSKFFREASAAVKLQSVALMGPPNIIAFESMLIGQPENLRHVQYLYISWAPWPDRVSGGTMNNKEQDELGLMMDSAIQSILTTVAGAVKVLELHAYRFMPGEMPPIPFPHLTHLASDGYPLRRSHNHFEASDSPIFPNLRRWHFMQPLNGYSDVDLVDCISKFAPLLTHLRISGVGLEDRLHVELATALNIKNIKKPYRSSIAEMMLSLKELYIKPSSYPHSGFCGTDDDAYDGLVEFLKELNSFEDDRFVLLEPYRRKEERRQALTTADWEAAINGEDGCWSLRGRLLPSNCTEDEEPESEDDPVPVQSLFD